MSLSLRATYLLIAAIVLSNFILWLDSFDRYLGSRYHVTLSEILPEAVFAPSRQLLALTGQSSEPPLAPCSSSSRHRFFQLPFLPVSTSRCRPRHETRKQLYIPWESLEMTCPPFVVHCFIPSPSG